MLKKVFLKGRHVFTVIEVKGTDFFFKQCERVTCKTLILLIIGNRRKWIGQKYYCIWQRKTYLFIEQFWKSKSCIQNSKITLAITSCIYLITGQNGILPYNAKQLEMLIYTIYVISFSQIQFWVWEHGRSFQRSSVLMCAQSSSAAP